MALIVQPERELGAVSLFLLAVVAASVAGGIWAGIGSSVLGFLSLNYFFTEPLHTFRVHNRDDVVALVVFLVVALLVGWVVARAVAERDRATRREREARLLNLFTTKALSGEPLDRVLNDLAAALVDALRLASCSIDATRGGSLVRGSATRPGTTAGVDGRAADLERRDRRSEPSRASRPAPRGARPRRTATARGGARARSPSTSSAPASMRRSRPRGSTPSGARRGPRCSPR